MDLNLWFNPSLLDKTKQKAAEAREADRPFVPQTSASSTVRPGGTGTSPFSSSEFTSTDSLSRPPGAGGDFSRDGYSTAENQAAQNAGTGFSSTTVTTTTSGGGGYSRAVVGFSPEEPNRLATSSDLSEFLLIYFGGPGIPTTPDSDGNVLFVPCVYADSVDGEMLIDGDVNNSSVLVSNPLGGSFAIIFPGYNDEPTYYFPLNSNNDALAQQFGISILREDTRLSVSSGFAFCYEQDVAFSRYSGPKDISGLTYESAAVNVSVWSDEGELIVTLGVNQTLTLEDNYKTDLRITSNYGSSSTDVPLLPTSKIARISFTIDDGRLLYHVDGTYWAGLDLGSELTAALDGLQNFGVSVAIGHTVFEVPSSPPRWAVGSGKITNAALYGPESYEVASVLE